MEVEVHGSDLRVSHGRPGPPLLVHQNFSREFMSLAVCVHIPCGMPDRASHVQLTFTEIRQPTAGDILSALLEQMNLPRYAVPESSRRAALFSIWIETPHLELQMKPRHTVTELIHRLPKYLSKYSHITDEEEAHGDSADPRLGGFKYRIVLRREAMLPKARERKLRSSNALELLVNEAHENVVSGRYPVGAADAVTLIAYLLALHCGPYDATKATSAGNCGDLVISKVPYHLRGDRSRADWESQVLTAYAGLGPRGTDGVVTAHLYLQLVRGLPSYGCTFYPCCLRPPTNGDFALRTEHMLVGVSRDGIVVLDELKHKLIFAQPYAHVSWGFTTDSVRFVTPLEDGDGDSTLTVISPASRLIDRLAYEGVRRVEREEENNAKEREKSKALIKGKTVQA